MSIGGGGDLVPQSFVIQNRGIWYDNSNGNMENNPVIPQLYEISVPTGRVWEIEAIDYECVIMESDAVTSDLNEGIFVVWGLGTDSIPEEVDLTGNTQNQPGGGVGPDQIAREDNQLFDMNELVLVKAGSSHTAYEDTTNGLADPGGDNGGLVWSDFIELPQPFVVDYRTDLEGSIAYTVSAGNGDTEDPSLHMMQSFTFWVREREASI